MRILVIYAHPVPESFNAAIHRTVLDALTAAGHEIDDLDLYAEGFDPVLTAEERRRYHRPGENLDGIEAQVERLRRAEALVLVFPTWWCGLPAILKGWLDRVWVPGVAFSLTPGGGPIRRGLTQIRKLGVVTTAGSPWWLMRWVQGEPVRALLGRVVRPLCARGARTVWLCHYNMDASTPASRERFLARVRKTFAAF